MAQRKIIEIDVQDGSFKKFAAAFAAFGAAVKDAISDVGDLDKAQAKAAKTGAKQAAAETKAVDGKRAKRKQAAKESEDQAKKDSEAEKKRVAEENRVELKRKKDRADAVKANKEIAKWTADVALSTGRAALNFAKWMTIGGLAGGFGLGALASSASNARRQSQGLGIDSGELRAAQVNFGKYIDPESMLGGIAEAQSSYGQQYRFGQLGVNAAGKDPAALLAEILPKLVDKFNAVGGKKEAADAMGLTAFASMDDLRRLSKLSREELSKTIAQYQKDRESLKVDDSVNQDWQSFLVAIHRAGQVIETSLIKHLAVLAPKLEDFATAVAKSIDTFLANHDLAKWLDAFSRGIAKAADYLVSDEFQSDIGRFMRGLKGAAAAMETIFLPFIDNSHNDKVNFAPAETPSGSWWQNVLGINSGPTDDANKAAAVKAFEGKYALPAGLLDNVWSMESGRGANNGLSKSGAGGDFQFMPGTAAEYGIKDRWDFAQSADAAARYLKKLLDKYNGDQQKALAAYNWGPGNLDFDINGDAKHKGHGADWLKYAPKETQNYVSGVKIVIQNNTGGNAQQTVAALGGG